MLTALSPLAWARFFPTSGDVAFFVFQAHGLDQPLATWSGARAGSGNPWGRRAWWWLQENIMSSSLYVRSPELGRKEANDLFNDALNTFYIRLYVVGHMVKDHSDSERGNPLWPHGLLFPISSKGSLYTPSHRHDNTYHSLCYTSRGALAGTRNRSMGPP